MKKTILFPLSAFLISALALAGCGWRKPVARDFTPTRINVGASANDGSGDPLRLAMMKINTNFTAISNAFVSMQAMATTVSNAMLTAIGTATNGFASTNYANSLATGTSNSLLTTTAARTVATSNALLTAIGSVTNGLVSTNLLNAQATTVSNAMLTAITGATNAFASTNLLNAGINSLSNSVTTSLATKANTNNPIFTGLMTNAGTGLAFTAGGYISGLSNVVSTNLSVPISGLVGGIRMSNSTANATLGSGYIYFASTYLGIAGGGGAYVNVGSGGNLDFGGGGQYNYLAGYLTNVTSISAGLGRFSAGISSTASNHVDAITVTSPWTNTYTRSYMFEAMGTAMTVTKNGQTRANAIGGVYSTVAQTNDIFIFTGTGVSALANPL